MPLRKNKKILIYIFFFILFSTLNNNNLLKFKFSRINQLDIYGLNEDENFLLKNELKILEYKSIFTLDKLEIKKILDSFNIIENYTISKKYPSSLEIKINRTNFLANVYNQEGIFFLGSNGKLIKTNEKKRGLLNIFGFFEKESFLKLFKEIDESKFELSEIKDLYFFKSGRWDLVTNSGILIKLPKYNLKDKLDLSFELVKKKNLIK